LEWAFNDLPKLPTDSYPKETGAWDGAHLAGDDTTSATIANPAKDEIDQIANSSAM
jgi:hypothetical protein